MHKKAYWSKESGRDTRVGFYLLQTAKQNEMETLELQPLCALPVITKHH